MNFSISSLFITLCISLVLITIFSLILTHEKSYHLFRADLLFVLVGITCLRLFFPFELPFTKTIALPSIMNPLTIFLDFEIFDGVNVLHFLIIIWLIGVLISMGRYVQNIISAKKIEDRIIQNSKCYKVSEILNHFIYPDYDVYISTYIPSPMVLGFKKCILIPDIFFTESELANILNHEMQHLKQNDILFKQVIAMLTILYWWFPPIYWLRKNVNLYIEVRADEKVTESLNSIATLEYAETLVNVQKKMHSAGGIISSNLSTYLIGESLSILSYRVNYLLNKKIKQKTNKILLIFLFLLPILSNSIIFEPFFENSNSLDGTLSEQAFLNDNYLIQHQDGTYSLSNGKEAFYIDNPNDLIKSGIKVVKE